MSAVVKTRDSRSQKPQGKNNPKNRKRKTSDKKPMGYYPTNKKKYEEKQEKDKRQILPPDDAKQFSTNWKIFEELLKKQPEHPQVQNGDLPKNMSAKTCNYKDIKADKVMQKEKDIVKPAKTIKTNVAKDSSGNETQICKATTSVTENKIKKNKKTFVDKHKAKKQKTETSNTTLTEEDIWFDDVDPDDMEATVGVEAAEVMRKKMGIHQSKNVESSLVKERAFEGITKVVAIDCEMVGIGPDGEESILARVSLVNQFGKCIYDKYVKATEKVTDYRTQVSGIRPSDIKNGENVDTVRKEVAEILEGRIVVGHAIHNDLKLLLLDHPKKKIRDTQKYMPFKKLAKSKRPALRVLCREVLNVNVQQGEHSSVQDAQATMRLYTMVKKQWEAEIKAGIKAEKDSEKKRRKSALDKGATVRTGLPA